MYMQIKECEARIVKLEDITKSAWNKFRITTADLSTELVLVYCSCSVFR